ncbi:PAP2 superfamily protein [Nitzschia inconspicua]|uniref:PAP2 superfamily protein n=1 Tax=Nitzschia inconspicua TaxID=303405 RepID=A0A9K3PE03_9STRA|nr:PAP2 superfamily protein [Nitzschia inconspicua]
MPLHRRHVVAAATNDEGTTAFAPDDQRRETIPLHPPVGAPSIKSHTSKSYQSLTLLILILLQAVLLMVAVSKAPNIRSTYQLIAIWTAGFFTSLPIFLSLAVGLGVFENSTSKQKLLPHQQYIPLMVVATIVGNQLPVYLSSAMAVVGITIFGLASRPHPQNKASPTTTATRQQQQQQFDMSGPLPTVFATFLMIAVLLTENFFVWVVSATYKPSYEDPNRLPKPLQDNGQITMRYIIHQVLQLSKLDVVRLRNMISVEWILVSGLGLSLVAIEMQGAKMKRNLWPMAMRAVLTLAAARFIRTISFLITVLPSQSPRCYFGHFSYPPPTEWSEWILEGMKPQVNGGCNDLIISGHATVTSTLACLVVSIVDKPLFTTALWMFVAMDYMVEVYEGFHYSVDMWLGAVMVNFIWKTLAPIETSQQGVETITAEKQFLALKDATPCDVMRYAFPALVTYTQVVQIIPQQMGNYTIVVFLCCVILQLIRHGFQQYTQHCLFCLLYMAFGIFL